MPYEVTVGGASVRAEVSLLDDGRYEVSLDGHKSVVDARFPEPGVMHMIRNGEAYEFDHSSTSDGHEITLYGTRYVVEVLDERRKVLRALGRGAEVGRSWQDIAQSWQKLAQSWQKLAKLVSTAQSVFELPCKQMQHN